MKRLKKLIDYRKSIMQYHLDYYSTFNIFRLQQEMLVKGICPNCGTSSRSWSSWRGHYPCDKCNFWITPKEVEAVTDDYGNISIKTQKRVLNKRLKNIKKSI
jgi:predicted RNA-binding Zn-ribbon protein involved in translation (DUF1610 family)